MSSWRSGDGNSPLQKEHGKLLRYGGEALEKAEVCVYPVTVRSQFNCVCTPSSLLVSAASLSFKCVCKIALSQKGQLGVFASF